MKLMKKYKVKNCLQMTTKINLQKIMLKTKNKLKNMLKNVLNMIRHKAGLNQPKYRKRKVK